MSDDGGRFPRGFKAMSWSNALVLLAVIVTGFIVMRGRALGGIQFKAFDLNAFSLSLAPLLVVALLIERSIEVFFGMWREPGDLARAAEKPPTVRDLIAAGVPPEAADPTGDLAKRKAENTHVAFVTNAVLSLFVALCGVRTLSLLIVTCQPAWGACTDTPARNLAAAPVWWQFADILLTAGLLGGGASGFHLITQVLGNYLEKAKNGAVSGAAGAARGTTAAAMTTPSPGRVSGSRLPDY